MPIPSSTNDVADYIGQQYDSCWAFVQQYYHDALGVEIAPMAHSNREDFYRVYTPMPGDIALFSIGEKVAHAGIYWCRGVLHHTPDKGVIYQRRTDATFYRYHLARPAIPDTE